MKQYLPALLLAASLFAGIAVVKAQAPGELPARFFRAAFDHAQLEAVFRTAPARQVGAAEGVVLSLPDAEGVWRPFRIAKAPCLAEVLQQRYPAIQSFAGFCTDDPAVGVRIAWDGRAMQAFIFQAEGLQLIEPARGQAEGQYIAYKREDYSGTNLFYESDEMMLHPQDQQAGQAGNLPDPAPYVAHGGTLRTYQIAVSTTGEYTAFHYTGALTPANDPFQAFFDVLSALNTTFTYLNGLYERELSVNFVVLTGSMLAPDALVYLNPATDPYNVNAPLPRHVQSQMNISSVMTGTPYELGHVFHAGTDGGIAGIGVVCNPISSALGWSATQSPSDAIWRGLVAHEIAHQFGANHTFYGNLGDCFVRTASTAYEPGSGSTLMSYAGLCGSQNVATVADHYFHTHSLQEMAAYVTTGAGGNCAFTSPLSNTPPVADAGNSGYYIPKGTPFTLTGSATDADGDALSYCWEQYDTDNTNGGAPNSAANSTTAPLFRSFSPSDSPVRTFPRLTDILANTQTTGEILPQVSRTINFRLTVRDNHPGGGGWDIATRSVLVDGSSGPFLVTSPNTAVTWNGGENQGITWDPAGTQGGLVNCQTVNILLSTNGGQSFPFVLASNTPNDGSESVVLPFVISQTARVKVECANGRFFDLSNANFTITSPFALSVSNERASACTPGTAVFNLNVVPGSANSLPVTLSASGLPAGATAFFSLNPVLPGNAANAAISMPAGILPGLYPISITGDNGAVIQHLALAVEALSPGAPLQPLFSVCNDVTTPINLYNLLTGESPQGVWVETSAVPSGGGAFSAGSASFTPSAQPLGTYSFRFYPTSEIPGLPALACNSSHNSQSGPNITFNGQQAAYLNTGFLACNPAGRANTQTYDITVRVTRYRQVGSTNPATPNNLRLLFLNASGTLLGNSNGLAGLGTYTYSHASFPAYDARNGFQVWATDQGNAADIRFEVDVVIRYPQRLQASCPTQTSTVNIAINCTQTTPVPTTIPTAPGTYTATDEVTGVDGWTHYFDDRGTSNPADDLYLLSVQKDGNVVIPTNGVSVGVTGSGSLNLSQAAYVSNPYGWFVMNRYWNVQASSQPGATGARVRFPYSQTDFNGLNASVTASGGPALAHQQLLFYKFATGSGVDPNPINNHTGANFGNFVQLTHNNTLNFNGANDHYAEFSVSGFSGGGAGAGGGGINSPFPVEWLSFEAFAREGFVWLQWATQREANNAWFMIERSTDGRVFEIIDQVKGRGNSAQPNRYLYEDQKPLGGVVFYRLKQVDYNGQSVYSPVVSVWLKNDASLRAYPNPFSQQITFEVSQPMDRPGVLIFYNMYGQQVFRSTLDFTRSTRQHTDVYHLPPGLYFYEYNDGWNKFSGEIARQ